MTRHWISPAGLIFLVVSVALSIVFAGTIICGHVVNSGVDTCPVPTIGNFAFPHPIIYPLAAWEVEGWQAIAAIMLADFVFLAVLWRSSTLWKRSWLGILLIFGIYVALSIITSSGAIYYYLTN